MNEKSHRKEKLAEIVHQMASEFVQKESNQNSMITITRVELSSDSKKAIVLFTVLPENQEKAALDFLKRNLSEFRHYVNQKTKIGHVPWFDFEIDEGEKSRQKIDTMI